MLKNPTNSTNPTRLVPIEQDLRYRKEGGYLVEYLLLGSGPAEKEMSCVLF